MKKLIVLLVLCFAGIAEGADDMDVIKRAADRNQCYGNDFRLLLAIRKAENGRSGREWGIMTPRANTFELQAAYAAATIVKNKARWRKAGSKGGYIDYLAKVYAPLNCKNDPKGLNTNWAKNVKHFYCLK
jgi:hypothetical protein